MWGLTIAFLLGLLRLISCQYFEELLKDVCFQKIYKCGDHRPRVTGNSERFETDPYQFGEMCRKHKEYIACVDDAVSNNCNESISDLALMTWSNRISLKMFCRNLEWWNNYFSSVSCINENKDKIQRDCDYEESIHVDDRPWWCLIQEPYPACLPCAVKVILGLPDACPFAQASSKTGGKEDAHLYPSSGGHANSSWYYARASELVPSIHLYKCFISVWRLSGSNHNSTAIVSGLENSK